jgi:hypothetical protein
MIRPSSDPSRAPGGNLCCVLFAFCRSDESLRARSWRTQRGSLATSVVTSSRINSILLWNTSTLPGSSTSHFTSSPWGASCASGTAHGFSRDAPSRFEIASTLLLSSRPPVPETSRPPSSSAAQPSVTACSEGRSILATDHASNLPSERSPSAHASSTYRSSSVNSKPTIASETVNPREADASPARPALATAPVSRPVLLDPPWPLVAHSHYVLKALGLAPLSSTSTTCRWGPFVSPVLTRHGTTATPRATCRNSPLTASPSRCSPGAGCPQLLQLPDAPLAASLRQLSGHPGAPALSECPSAGPQVCDELDASGGGHGDQRQ